MPLTGINKKCGRCEGKCKQFEQQVVVYCPLFRKRVMDMDDEKNDLKNTQ